MGGQRVTFIGLDDECQSANNSAFFVNRGTTSQESPTDVICAGCYLEGGGITVRIDNSIRSGVRSSTIVAGHLSAVHISKGSAVDPVWLSNSIIPFSSSAGPAPSGPKPKPGAGPSVKVASVGGRRAPLPLAMHKLGGVGIIETLLQVDQAVVLHVSAVEGAKPSTSKALLPLLKASRIGTSVSGTPHTTLIGRATPAQLVQLVLRIPWSSLHAGMPHLIRVVATDSSGSSVTLLIAFQ